MTVSLQYYSQLQASHEMTNYCYFNNVVSLCIHIVLTCRLVTLGCQEIWRMKTTMFLMVLGRSQSSGLLLRCTDLLMHILSHVQHNLSLFVQALHFKKYSTASDVWSYGAVMYEIWSIGHKPFEGYTNSQVG